MNDSPCFNCHERHAGCHGKCKQYAEWHEDHIRRSQELRSKIEAENSMRSFYVESGEKIRKKKRAK